MKRDVGSHSESNKPWVQLVPLVVACLWSATAFGQLDVLNSGGFAVPYRTVLPIFESNSGLIVSSTLAASQGSGPSTIPALLRSGAPADVVIMSKEGLNELVAEGRVLPETVVDLAQTPLGVAVRTGTPRPDIDTVEAFKQLVLQAKSINLVSTTGLYMTQELFPSLGIGSEVARKSNGDRMANLANTQVDLVLRPVSELINLSGFDFVGPLPAEIQFVSVFSAGAVTGTRRLEAAQRLIAFLSSEEVQKVAVDSGMQRVGAQ